MAHKRANGEGSVYQRKDKMWIATVPVPGGRPKLFSATTRAAAVEKRSAALGMAEPESAAAIAPPPAPVVPTDPLTLGKYLPAWFATLDKRPSTLRAYKSYLNGHLIPTLGHIRLAALTADDIRAMLAQCKRKGLAPRTVRQIRAILSKALGDAVESGNLAVNITKSAKLGRIDRFAIDPFTPEEVVRLQAALATEKRAPIYLTALALGLRSGELRGLRWRDIDLVRGTMIVRHQVQRYDGGMHLDPLKTDGSRRTLHLPPTVIAALRAQHDYQRMQRAQAGTRWREQGFVFTTRWGTPYETSNLYHYWKKFLATHGLREQRLHDLRHAAATLALGSGADLHDVKNMLGHKSITLTGDTYGHVSEQSRERVAAVMERVLAGA